LQTKEDKRSIENGERVVAQLKNLVNQSSLEDPNLKLLGFGNKPAVTATEKK
jgi:hypothetical protein